MKIVVLGSHGIDTLETNLADAFNLKGFQDVKRLNWPPQNFTGRANKVKKILRKLNFLLGVYKFFFVSFFNVLKKFKPDLIIVCTGASKYLTPEMVIKLKTIADEVVCWFVDASVNVSKNLLFSNYDHIYFVDKGLLEYLSPILRSNSSLLLEGYHPIRHRPIANLDYNNKIVVVGGLYPERILFLEKLVNSGFDLEIYGFGLPKNYGNGVLRAYDMKKYLTYEEKSRVFAESRCVLNNFHPSHLNAINCRVFEALAAGSLVVSQRSSLIEEYFTHESDLLLFDDFNDAINVLRKLFSNEYDESKIRKNAARSVENHSLKNRVESLIS